LFSVPGVQYSCAQLLPVPKTFASLRGLFMADILKAQRQKFLCPFSSFYGVSTPIKMAENMVIKELLDNQFSVTP
jgi:hypothetical protein